MSKPDDLSPELQLELEILAASRNEVAADSVRRASDRYPVILVADGDESLRAYIRRCVERSCGVAADAVEAADGRAALRIIARERVDLAVCEIDLPGMGGIELVAAMRTFAVLASIPVILTAGPTMPRSERARIERLQRVILLDRPFNARKLCASIRRMLDPDSGP